MEFQITKLWFIFKNNPALERFIVKNISTLHAKVIISDRKRALVSSSNLTLDELKNNIEFGVELNGDIIADLFRRIQYYWDKAEKLVLKGSVDKTRRQLEKNRKKQKTETGDIDDFPISGLDE